MTASQAARETHHGTNARNAIPDSAPDQPHIPLAKVSHLDEWAVPGHGLVGTSHPGLLPLSPRESRNSTTPLPRYLVPVRRGLPLFCPAPAVGKTKGSPLGSAPCAKGERYSP